MEPPPNISLSAGLQFQSEFKLQLHYYIHFWTNAPWERYEFSYPTSYSINSITADFLQGWY